MGVITEQNYQSLMDTWLWQGLGPVPEAGGPVPAAPFGPETTRTEGKIASLSSIHRFLKNSHEEYVFLSDCDVVANVDYKEVFQFHSDKQADVTVIYRHGTSPDTDRNVVFTVDPEGVVRDMLIKRGSDADCNYGMASTHQPQAVDGFGGGVHEPQPLRL